jgi:hypothetical protein
VTRSAFSEMNEYKLLRLPERLAKITKELKGGNGIFGTNLVTRF